MRKILAHPVFDRDEKHVKAIRMLVFRGDKVDLITHKRGSCTGRVKTIIETFKRTDFELIDIFMSEHVISRRMLKQSGYTWQELLNMLHDWYADFDRDLTVTIRHVELGTRDQSMRKRGYEYG